MLPASCAQAVMVMMVMMMKKMVMMMVMMIPRVGISMYSGRAILYFDK